MLRTYRDFCTLLTPKSKGSLVSEVVNAITAYAEPGKPGVMYVCGGVSHTGGKGSTPLHRGSSVHDVSHLD